MKPGVVGWNAGRSACNGDCRWIYYKDPYGILPRPYYIDQCVHKLTWRPITP